MRNQHYNILFRLSLLLAALYLVTMVTHAMVQVGYMYITRFGIFVITIDDIVCNYTASRPAALQV